MIQLKGEERLSLDETFRLIGKINALIYVRVSTSDQAKKGYSLDSQVELCKQRAVSKFGFTEKELIVIIEEGKMGDDPNRPALNYVLYLLEKGLGKKLIMLHPDRFTRDNTLQGVISRKVWSLGVDIEFIEFDVDPTNPESMLMYNIQGSIAQYNKAKILANSRRGRVQKARKGELPSFKRLYGYTYDKKTKTLVVDEDEEAVYLDVVDMLLNQNMSCNQIARELSKNGIPAPSSNIWYQTTVTRMLRNETYTGKYYYGKTKVEQVDGKKKQVPRPKEEWIKIDIPSLVDEETFVMIQDKVDSLNLSKGRKSNTYMLKGVVKCGRCGASAGSGVTSKVKDRVHRYYACRNKFAKGYVVGTGKRAKKCNGRNWRVDMVDDVVWNWLVDKINQPDLLIKQITDELSDTQQIHVLEKEKEAYQMEILELEREEMNYAVLFGKGKVSEQMYDELTTPIKRKREATDGKLRIIISKLSNIKGNHNEKTLLKNNLKEFQQLLKVDLDIKYKRFFVQSLIEKVVLHEDYSIEIVSKWCNDKVSMQNHKAENNYNHTHKKQNNVQANGRSP